MYLTDVDFMKYKFVIIIDGWGTTDRFPGQLAYRSVIFKRDSVAFESWYGDLIPYVHFIPFTNASHLLHILTNIYEFNTFNGHKFNNRNDLFDKCSILCVFAYLYLNFVAPDSIFEFLRCKNAHSTFDIKKLAEVSKGGAAPLRSSRF